MAALAEAPKVRRAKVSPEDRIDEDLLVGYTQTGDRRLFEQLVAKYARELFSYLRRYLGNAEMAEDAFQQTFLQVHLKCDQYEPGRKVRPWLYTVATNQAIDLQRRNHRHCKMVSLDRNCGADGADDESGALADLLLASSVGDPSDDLTAREQSARMRRLVDRLPEQLRAVTDLVYYHGLKYREAADQLRIHVGTVKSRLHAAIQKLRDLYRQSVEQSHKSDVHRDDPPHAVPPAHQNPADGVPVPSPVRLRKSA